MRDRTRSLRTLVAAALVSALLAGCGRDGDDLWKRDFPATAQPAAGTAGDITGYWQGDVAMGGIRLRIEPERMTLAMRCDADGRKVAQASAAVRLDRDGSTRLVLQDDLAGGDEDCGFRFAKGAEFRVALDGPRLLQIGFAGDATSRLRKLAELPPR